MCHPSPPSLSLVWLPEGLHRSKGNSIAAQRSTVRILDRIQTELLLQSRLDSRSGRSHHSPYVYMYYEVCTCGTNSLCRCCRTGVVASRSSWPWGRLCRLHYQCMCGGVIPAIGLRGYITNLQLIVTSLLLDRSCAILGCIGNKILLFVPNPNSGIRVWSMRSMLVRLEHITICGRW
jgi:hypothetical protein